MSSRTAPEIPQGQPRTDASTISLSKQSKKLDYEAIFHMFGGYYRIYQTPTVDPAVFAIDEGLKKAWLKARNKNRKD